MPRRRPTLRAYLRRRWRTMGFLVVLFLGALLILAITDRGHDPLWQGRISFVEQLSISPDGAVVYALGQADQAGPITHLEARSGRDGATLWRTDLNETAALIAADDGGVALATDFPRAFAIYYDEQGRPRSHTALEGTPRALSLEQGVIAVALRASGGGDQVLVIEDGLVVRSHRFAGIVNALDLRAEHLVVGTSVGELALFAPNGTQLHNEPLALDIRSVRLSANAQALIVGGYDQGATSLSGGVAFLDFSDEPLVEWTQRTSAGVGLVDISADGTRAIAVEEAGARHRLHAYDTAAVRETWGKLLSGIVARDDAGHGGAAISPDGATVIVGTQLGVLRAFDGGDGRLLWTYGSEGTTSVAFRQTYPSQFVANARLAPNGPLESILLFSPTAEPIASTVTGLAAFLGIGIAVGGVVILGVGYWRLRRQAS